ncbi:hypothetical protein [Cellulomonas palmilytica]|uniref:hypothetical protein n=1 Tax=Cellulomonas palmilytica TaxID=2608402 RepID=UPI001F3C3F8F|nr:hypothetical protein [Cellulomonas palmilytica]UJP39655.1 hypothetical protein F1D97_15325 [Cellulomonas palmilytica]
MKKIQFTPVDRSSMQLPTLLLAPIFGGSQGRGVPAAWRTSDDVAINRHRVTVYGTALDPLRASLV